MKKNVFSRTLAVLASTAVLGAASMISANAAGETLSLSSAEGYAGDVVTITVDVACNNNFESLDAVVNWDDTALTVAPNASTGENVAEGAGAASAASASGDGFCTVVAWGTGAIKDGSIAKINFQIPADAEPGTVYDIYFGTVTTYAIYGGDDLGSGVTQAAGQITVLEEATDAPTEAPTDAPTEAPTTTPAPTTTAAPSTGAPKTGNAGVAVAVAGLVAAGATAVVLKKRH